MIAAAVLLVLATVTICLLVLQAACVRGCLSGLMTCISCREVLQQQWAMPLSVLARVIRPLVVEQVQCRLVFEGFMTCMTWLVVLWAKVTFPLVERRTLLGLKIMAPLP